MLSFNPADRTVRPVFLLGLVLAATFVVYAATLRFEFVYDVLPQIVSNPIIQKASFLPHYFRTHVWIHTAPQDVGNYYRPLFLVWLLLNYQLFGANPMGWHATTVLAHLAATAMVYFTARRLTRNHSVGLLAALIFGLHPIHIEAVAWISGVTEPLLAVPFLGSFLCFARARESGSRRWWAASLLLYVVAMLLKETALILPAMCFLYEWIYRPQGGRAAEPQAGRLVSALRVSVPFLLLTAAYVPLRIYALHGFSHPVNPVSLRVDLLTFPSLLWFYVTKLVYPVGLSIFYDTPYVLEFGTRAVLLPLLGVASVAGALILMWRHRPSQVLPFSAALLLVPLLPLFNLSTFQAGEIAHDRYLYLPSVGFSILAALALLAIRESAFRVGPLAGSRALAIAFVALFLAAATVSQSLHWANNLVLYFRGVQVAPTNNLAGINLANELLDRGLTEQALVFYHQALEREPGYWLSIYNLGYAYYRTGRYPQAEPWLTRAALGNNRDADSAYYLGITKWKLGKLDEAAVALRAALEREPRGRGYRYSLGLVLKDQGKIAEALEMFETELKRNPHCPEPLPHIAALRKKLGASGSVTAAHDTGY
jgi:tetratricopeptide (TPR) repeat protein